MATITSAGLGSGLDVTGLVSSLIAAEGQPATLRLDNRAKTLTAELSAFGTLQSAVEALKSAAAKLGDADAFSGRTATSSETGTLTASATDSAVPGTYSVELVRTAQTHKIGSATFNSDANPATGSLTLTLVNGETATTSNLNGMTLAQIRDEINALGISVSATLVNGSPTGTLDAEGNAVVEQRLVLTSGVSGSEGGITASGKGALDLGLDYKAAGSGNSNNPTMNVGPDGLQLVVHGDFGLLDAELLVEGLAVTSTTNTFSGVISGVTLTAGTFSTDGSNNATITVVEDRAAMKTAAQSFVEKYNALRGTLKALGSYNASTGKGSVLVGDSTLRSVEGQLRSIFRLPEGGAFGGLGEIGIEVDAEGELSLDEAAFDAALESNSTAVRDLFVSPNGIAASLEERLARYIGDDGLIAARTDGLEKRIDDIEDQRLALGRRLASMEERLMRQFTALDGLLNQLQTTSSSLGQMLDSLPGAWRPKGS